MEQILGLQIICVGFLLLTGAGRGCEGGSASAEAALLSDSESYHDKCEGFECPECPDDSSLSEASDSRESYYADDVQMHSLLQPQFRHDRERAKRDLQTDLQADCCGTCHCNKCPEQPKCQRGEVLIELHTASGLPGNCCTQFKCGQEPQCEGDGTNVTYWLDSCSKCNSCQQPSCQDVCYQADPPHNCMSSDKKLMFNDQTWLEGCIECRCIAGDKQCIAPKDCQLYDGEVPEVEKSTTTTTTSTSTTATSVTTEAAVVVQVATNASIGTSMEESEPKANSVESVAVPEIVEIELEQQSKKIELQKQSVEEELKQTTVEAKQNQPTVESELKQQKSKVAELLPQSANPDPNTNSTESALTPNSLELKLLNAHKMHFSESTSNELPDTTEPTIESDFTEELSLENTELPQLEEKLEVVTMDGINTDSTADLPSSTSSTLQTDDSMEESTAASLDNIELDTTVMSAEATSSSASSLLPTIILPYSTTIASTTSSASASTSATSSIRTTESPAELAISSPAPLTPESTSFHRDKDIRDTDYRLASSSSHDASKHPTNLHNLLNFIVLIAVGIIVIIVPLAVFAYLQRRKSMYSSVPHSDSNLSENTRASDLVLNIDLNYDDNNLPQKQQLKESVE